MLQHSVVLFNNQENDKGNHEHDEYVGKNFTQPARQQYITIIDKTI